MALASAAALAAGGTEGFSGDGGPATSAELTQAFDVAVDSAGDLLFTDVDNGRTRMVSG
jgi:hypothetical protein